MSRRWKPSEDQLIASLRATNNTWEEIGDKLGATQHQVRFRYARYLQNQDRQFGSMKVATKRPEKDIEIVYSGDDCRMTYIGEKIKTVEELLAFSKIDTQIWEVAEVKLNNWEVAGKRKNGQDENGRMRADSLWKTPLNQIMVKLRRRAPKNVQDGIKDLLSKVPSWRGKLPKVVRSKRSADHLLEISLYDSHFGKLCWEPETGTDYNLRIAKSDYEGAAEDLLNRLGGFSIEKVILPVGHDMLNFDNLARTTTNGTMIDSTDDRLSKVFSTAYDAVQSVVMKCREVAEVEVIWVPGNHDRAQSWYLCEMLRKVFEGDKFVSVDNSPPKRKYREYGVSLIGYDHGESMPLDRLPLTMANEAPSGWANCTFRHYRVGHYHKKKQLRWVGNDTFQGVDVTILPSLSGTDSWHYIQGYVSNHRAAEAALWNRDSGPVGSFIAEARSAIQKRKDV
jgi:hypothetical protein